MVEFMRDPQSSRRYTDHKPEHSIFETELDRWDTLDADIQSILAELRQIRQMLESHR